MSFKLDFWSGVVASRCLRLEKAVYKMKLAYNVKYVADESLISVTSGTCLGILSEYHGIPYKGHILLVTREGDIAPNMSFTPSLSKEEVLNMLRITADRFEAVNKPHQGTENIDPRNTK